MVSQELVCFDLYPRDADIRSSVLTDAGRGRVPDGLTGHHTVPQGADTGGEVARDPNVKETALPVRHNPINSGDFRRTGFREEFPLGPLVTLPVGTAGIMGLDSRKGHGSVQFGRMTATGGLIGAGARLCRELNWGVKRSRWKSKRF